MCMKSLEHLRSVIGKYNHLMIAFSGGVDSTFLLAVAKDMLQDRVVAVTSISAIQPENEKEEAIKIARGLGVNHILIKSDVMQNPEFLENRRNRCYRCKKIMFQKMMELGDEMDSTTIAHGANIDDLNDFRPGFRAATEMNIRAPLIEAKLGKEDIRKLSRKMNLSTWNKPPMACLATRIPYHTKINEKILRMVDDAEMVVKGMGFGHCRVRFDDKGARIEVARELLGHLLEKETRNSIVQELKKIGFKFVAVDLEGYRTGSMNAL